MEDRVLSLWTGFDIGPPLRDLLRGDDRLLDRWQSWDICRLTERSHLGDDRRWEDVGDSEPSGDIRRDRVGFGRPSVLGCLCVTDRLLGYWCDPHIACHYFDQGWRLDVDS